MKTQDVILFGAAVLAGALALGAMKRAQAATDTNALPSVEEFGTPSWMKDREQRAGYTDAQIAQNWADLSAALDKTQPDFWM